MGRLRLPDVTLCAAASVNVAATVSALNRCLDQVEFAQSLLFTDADSKGLELNGRISLVRIEPIVSAEAYSHFLLRQLINHVGTAHCLVVQWDGFVRDASRWNPDFLLFDYIGAPWPQFNDGHEVGNGGFSLRSRRLLEACQDPEFVFAHPEDVCIARTNRGLLEQKYKLRFADRAIAQDFAFERSSGQRPTFGFHGIFNLIDAIGPEAFWDVYRSLDDRQTIAADYLRLLKQLGLGRRRWARRANLTLDRLKLLS